VLVLRKNQGVRERAETGADVAERNVAHLSAGDPDIRRDDFPSARDHRVGETELAVPLERACLHRNRARRGPGLWRLVNDPDGNAEARQPQREHQTGGAGADDENGGVAGW
jgi:hypothetical protein